MKLATSSPGCSLSRPKRSPRQCSGPVPTSPRRLCVVIGPFRGWKSCCGTKRSCFRPSGMVDQLAFGIAEVPGQTIQVAKDMTAGAGQRSMAGGARGIIEQGAPGLDDLRRRVVTQRHRVHDGSAPRVDDADRSIQAVEHVEPVPPVVVGQTGRTEADVDAVDDRRHRAKARRPCATRRPRHRPHRPPRRTRPAAAGPGPFPAWPGRPAWKTRRRPGFRSVGSTCQPSRSLCSTRDAVLDEASPEARLVRFHVGRLGVGDPDLAIVRAARRCRRARCPRR